MDQLAGGAIENVADPADIGHPRARVGPGGLQQQVVGPIVEDDRAALEEFGRRYETLRDSMPNGREHSENYDRLRAHLLVSRPRDPSEPLLNDNEEVRDWVAERITERWAERMGGEEEIDEESLAEMRSQADLYTSLLAAEETAEELAQDGFGALPAGLRTLDVMQLSLEVLQSMVLRYRLAGYPPDLLITVPKSAGRLLDFHRAGELIELGRRMTEEAIDRADEFPPARPRS